MPIGFVWQTFLETPLINIMVALTALTFGSYGLALLLFTCISRALLFPLTLRMLHSMRHMQEIQPKMQEIQKRYSDPKRRNEEIMKLYKEAGVNPLGCIGPQLLQFPIFIALYQVIRITLGNTPESVLDLSGRLYNVDFIQHAVPLSRHFLWMDLGANGNILLFLLVFGSMWLQQRITSSRTAATSEQQRQMNSMMQWMLPVLFGSFVLFTPSGLGLYWFASTSIGIVLQWIFVGPGDFTWGSLIPESIRESLGIPSQQQDRGRRPRRVQPDSRQSSGPDDGRDEARTSNASSGDERTNGRRGDRPRSGSTRPASRSGRRRRHHRG